MLAVTRQSSICDIIQKQKSISVDEMAKMFSVSKETIRRDLEHLEKNGVLTRTYGGAFLNEGVGSVATTSFRRTYNSEGKNTIAQIADAFINDGDTIFLDSSTTALYIANHIKNRTLTIVTNSLLIMTALSESKSIKLVGLGGTFDHTFQAFVGPSVVNAIKNIYVDKAFVTSHAISIEHGLTDISEDISSIRLAISERCRDLFLVISANKFDKTSFVSSFKLQEVSTLITDLQPDSCWEKHLKDNDVPFFFNIAQLTQET